MGGPLAGLVSFQILQASSHSAADRAGTVVDGHNQQIVTQYSRRDHRRWSPHLARSRNRQAKPNQTVIGYLRNTRRPRHAHDASTDASAASTSIIGQSESKRAGGHSGPPLRGGFVSEKVTWDPKPILVFDPARPARTSVATRCAVECGADVPGAGHFSHRGLEVTDHSASGRAGTVVDGHNQQIVTQYPRRDHRRWSPHMEASRNEQAKPNPSHNGIRVSSGEIGTHAIHPPGKRSIDINKSHFHTETRIRTQRPDIGRFCDPSFHPQQQHPLQR